MKNKEIIAYNQAIDDILMKIVLKEIKGVKLDVPPEALLHTFEKLKK